MNNIININFAEALFEKFCNGNCCTECLLHSKVDENSDCKDFFQEQLIKNNINTNITMEVK